MYNKIVLYNLGKFIKVKLENTTLVDVYTQLHEIGKQFEKKLQDAPYINNGPEKETVVTVEVKEKQDRALMLHSFFCSHKDLIPAGIKLKIDIDPLLLAEEFSSEINPDFDGCVYNNQNK